MDDTRFVYQEDLKDKSVTAKSSHARPKRGKYMRTPSDYLSKKEIAAMNSEVVTYSIVPMKWGEFMKMPDDIQKNYIESLIKRFGANISRMAVMFDISVKTVSNRCKTLRVKFPTPNKFNLEAWNEFVTVKPEPEFGISPISYEQFMKLPDENKKEWLEFVMQTFGIQGLDFGKIFGVNAYTFRTKMYKKWDAHKGNEKTPRRYNAFAKWMRDGGIDIPDEEVEVSVDASEIEPNNAGDVLIPIEEKPSTEVFAERWGNDIPKEKDEFEELGRFLKYVKSIGGSVSISINI